MDMTNKKVAVVATVTVVGKIKGQELLKPETFNTHVFVERKLITEPTNMQLAVHEKTRQAFARAFMDRMRKNPTLKHQIGGIRWEVQVLDCRYRDAY